MREKRSYDAYYDNKERGYIVENKKKNSGLKGIIFVAGVGVVGYMLGYKKARNTAKTILDTVFEKYPDKKEAFSKVWNMAVDEYFDKK